MSDEENNTESTSPDPSELQKSFGEWLKSQRESKNVSLEEIAAVTKVHIHQLRCIEDDRWSELPAPAFVRGFLICYADHLGLDEDYVLKAYKKVMGSSVTTIESALPDGLEGVKSATTPDVRVASSPNFEKSPGAKSMDVNEATVFSGKKLGIGIGVLVLLGLLIALISVGKNEQVEEKTQQQAQLQNIQEPQPAPEETANAAEASDGSTDNAQAAPDETQEAAPQYTLKLVGVDESWVNTRIDDERSAGETLRRGQVKSFDVKEKVRLVLSNAGAVEIVWNKTRYEAPGFRGDVKTINLPQDLDQLKVKKWKPKPKPKPPANTGSSLPGSSPSLPGAPAADSQ